MTSGALIADRYRLLKPLPAVSPRVLWQARDEWSGQWVAAARVPMPGMNTHEILHARYGLSREVRAAENCRHRHLVRPIDTVLDADDLWVISELGPPTTLAGELAQHGGGEPEQAARWGRDIADGLAAAHEAGVLHRDLHPGVVGLAEDGAAIVGGFASTVVCWEGLRDGIPIHVAPELARGADPVPASDVFALGAMLYTAIEGSGPFADAGNRMQTLQAAVAGALTPPSRAGDLTGLLLQMLHPDPAQRPSAATVRDQLARIESAQQPGNDQLEPPVPIPPAGRTGSSRRGLWLVLAALLTVVVLAIAMLMAMTHNLPLVAPSIAQPGPVPSGTVYSTRF